MNSLQHKKSELSNSMSSCLYTILTTHKKPAINFKLKLRENVENSNNNKNDFVMWQST